LALPLYERALDGDSTTLVRLTDAGLVIGSFNATVPEDSPTPPLLPSRTPGPGEQYRFHFNMTRCIGCRSCEVACNEQNGNPAEIQWRRLGEVEGGTYPNTLRHYLSMGCNHCLDAECLKGCPVNAYTKDPVTGIVLHSTDACIGCQYCVWNCPYSVPQFNPERGVVGKCDMCKGRLEDGLEPACVNACPEAAIEIEIVNKSEWRSNFAAAESPGMPAAVHTLSTTRITLPETAGAPLERVDAGQIHPEHAHMSLIFMTTIMQGVVGALPFLLLHASPTALALAVLLSFTAIALTASTTHLGRPAYAWRALRMWRRSWLSREVLLFTLFFGSLALATLLAVESHPATGPNAWLIATCCTTCVLGIAATIASACIYLVPARPSWNMVHTPIDFLLTAALLGSVSSACFGESHALATLLLGMAWTTNHASRVWRLRSSESFEANASFSLLTSDQLLPCSFLSLGCVAVGLSAQYTGHPLLALLSTWTGTLFARYLFFVSVVPLKMALTFVRGRAA
jgi:formate dehydrogenase iron-sulfur subunit